MTEQTQTTATTKTPEQLAAEAQAAITAKNAEKEAANAKKAAEKEEAKKKKEAEKQAKEQAKLDAKAKKEAETKEKAAAKEAQKANKETVKMPEQNGIRRPKPGGACGNVWAMADEMSRALGQPVPIANLSVAAGKAGINESTIRTQYAAWRKFNGVTGRVVAPAPVAAEPAANATVQGAANVTGQVAATQNVDANGQPTA